MKKELSDFESYMKNCFKKKKNIDDQKFLDELCDQMKKNHKKQQQQQIDELHRQLKKIEG